jgi:hypothetical protein
MSVYETECWEFESLHAHCDSSSVALECQLVTLEVTGSSPVCHLDSEIIYSTGVGDYGHQ